MSDHYQNPGQPRTGRVTEDDHGLKMQLDAPELDLITVVHGRPSLTLWDGGQAIHITIDPPVESYSAFRRRAGGLMGTNGNLVAITDELRDLTEDLIERLAAGMQIDPDFLRSPK